MSLSKSLKTVRQEAKVSELFPITHLNSPNIFESQSGLIGSVIRIQGVAFDIEDPDNLNYQGFLLHQALLGLDERFIVYVTTHRKKVKCVLSGSFQSKFTDLLNRRYHDRFKNQHLYTNDLYFTVVLKGDTSTKTASWINKTKHIIGKRTSEIAAQYRETQIEVLTRTVNQLRANLEPFGARLLGDNDVTLGYSELMQFLSLIVNAGQSLPYQKPVYSQPIANDIPHTFKAEQIYPNGHLGQYLCRYQLLFGESIQFQGNTANDVYFGAMLSLKKYPINSYNILLDTLLSLDCEFISTHTFAPSARDTALKTILQKRSKLLSIEDKAQSQIESLKDLEDGIASESMLLGVHHHTIMLIAANKPALETAILEATKCYASSGVVVVKETLGIEPAFWSQIPCNQHMIARAALITSLNFVDFAPFHNPQTGFINQNFLGEAVTLLETSSRTPVFFNYHSKGSKSNPSKGHAAVFGGNNAGKTTLVNFLDAQMGRYHHRSFFIDRDESSKIYILACGNSSYTQISPSHSIAMNPLQLPDNPENRAFLKSWLGTLVQLDNETNIPSDIAEMINECIDYAFEQLSPTFRTLSHISQFFPINFSRWPQLRQWLKGSHERINGEYNWLFDNEDDALSFDFDKVGFDVTYLMDCTTATISTPVYLYLVHRMRQCLDGRLTSFVIDEAWQLFASPFWEKCLKEWLPTIRKKNGHFIFMTQSPKTVITSAIQHVVLDNLATMLVFPNAIADIDTYINHLKLTETQFQAIKDSTSESRVFLYKQDNDAMLCKLDLSEMPDLIGVLSGNVKSIRLLNSIMEASGTNPNIWLPIFLERNSQ